MKSKNNTTVVPCKLPLLLDLTFDLTKHLDITALWLKYSMVKFGNLVVVGVKKTYMIFIMINL